METIRAQVIEKAVGFEDLISQLLIMLLDIENNTSISFGTKNLALGFNSKVNLLVDLNFISKEVITDFQIFTEIRNKFAHVIYADNFTKCMELLSTSSKNKFKEIYGQNSNNFEEEVIYMSCFEILCFRISMWLSLTLKIISEQKSQNLKKIGAIEMIRSFINYDELKRIEQLNSFINTITPIIKEIHPDEDFMKTYNELLIEQEEKQNNL